MAIFHYQGHGSYRFTTDAGLIIYVDPYAGTGYDLPADLILVTHWHADHNRIELVTQKPGCRIITQDDALADGKHQTFTVNGIEITAVEANNRNHDPKTCVGYLVTMDGLKLYLAGDTSTTAQMETFAALHLDYAILPMDGVYNMDPAEASACAKKIGAKHNIPVHTETGTSFDRVQAERFEAAGRVIVEPGEEIVL